MDPGKTNLSAPVPNNEPATTIKKKIKKKRKEKAE
jgi:hypothetical protein